MKDKIVNYLKQTKGYFIQAGILSAYYIILELIFHFMQGYEVNSRLIYPIAFCLPLGFFIAAVNILFPRKVNIGLTIVAMIIPAFWACVQICYEWVFQTYMDTKKVFMGGDVAENFGNELKDAIISNIPSMLIYLGLVLAVSLLIALKFKPNREPIKVSIGGVILAIVFYLCSYGLLYKEGTGAYTPIDLYKMNPAILDNNMQNFGLITSLRIDVSQILFPRDDSDIENAFKEDNMSVLLDKEETGENNEPSTEEKTETSTESGTEPSTESGSETETGNNSSDDNNNQQGSNNEGQPPAKTQNVLDIDFDALLANTDDKAVTAVHQYMQSLSGSNVNEYTGYFEGYNLIMICAESFTSYMISEELTPTLYKLSNNGFVFENYYGTFKSITTNGEYAFCTGLLPNTVGSTEELKVNSTFAQSIDRYLPYCMGNVFNDLDYGTYAYHSNNGDYYRREETHLNMGYKVLRFLDGSYIDGVFDGNAKLKYTTMRPNSDEETIMQTMSDYLNNKDENGNVKPFHAYYMTYSGHHPYYDIDEEDKTKSPMVFENRDKVDNLEVSSNVKAYIAANLELENMLTELLKGLEEAGCLENTVIVLTNDHYPYGLRDNQFKELVNFNGNELERTFGMYRNTFICYNAGMEEKVVVSEPCCTVDIIPTLLNLFGIDYDSRLLAGTDVLDTKSFHIAMLYNQSFVTDKIKYDTSSRKITYLVDQDEVSQEYIDACITYVKNKFEMSLQIINTDYYRIIYDSFEVE